MVCLFSRESRIQIEVILLATSFNSSLALPIAHPDVCIPTTRLTRGPQHPRHYGRCDRDCKGSSGIWCEELLKSAEVVTNWTSSVNVSYPRMTADLLESQGDMYRTKTGVFLLLVTSHSRMACNLEFKCPSQAVRCSRKKPCEASHA